MRNIFLIAFLALCITETALHIWTFWKRLVAVNIFWKLGIWRCWNNDVMCSLFMLFTLPLFLLNFTVVVFKSRKWIKEISWTLLSLLPKLFFLRCNMMTKWCWYDFNGFMPILFVYKNDTVTVTALKYAEKDIRFQIIYIASRHPISYAVLCFTWNMSNVQFLGNKTVNHKLVTRNRRNKKFYARNWINCTFCYKIKDVNLIIYQFS